MNKVPAKASDPNDLERHILDPNIAKSEAEWWAKRRIEELEREDAAWRKLNEQADKTVDRAEQERGALLADNERLREVLAHVLRCVPIGGFAQIHWDSATWADIDSALAATPKQSLARIRNQVREECAAILDDDDADLYDLEFHAAAIRSMKEPE